MRNIYARNARFISKLQHSQYLQSTEVYFESLSFSNRQLFSSFLT